MLQDMLKDTLSGHRPSAEELLAALGLERRRSTLESVGSAALLVAGGMVIGAGIGMLLAPKSGAALRGELRAKATDLAERIGDKAEGVTHELRGALALDDGEKSKSGNQSKREEGARSRS